MEKLKSSQNAESSPFFNLLADAEAIEVREVSSSNAPGIVASIETAVREFDRAPESSDYRAFLVQVKTPKPKVAAPANSPSELQTQEHLIRCAEVLISNGDYLLARNLFSFVLKQDIRQRHALKGLGICLYRLGDTTSAKKCFKACYEVHHAPEALVWMAECHIAEKNDAGALELFQQISNPLEISSHEDRFHYFKEMGNCLTRGGHLKEAAAAYLSALELQPLSDVVYINLGTLELQRQQIKQAYEFFSKAKEINPKSPRAHCGLGLVALSRNDINGAIVEFNRTIELDSQNLVALFQLLTLAHLTGDYAGVKVKLVKFLFKEPRNTDVRFALASLLFKDSDWMGCEKEVDCILQLEPTNLKAQKLKEELISNRHRA